MRGDPYFFEAKLSGFCILPTHSSGDCEFFSEDDFELETFGADEFEVAVLRRLQNPPPNMVIRKSIQRKSSGISVDQCSKKYHQYISSLITK
jgi:hypothetical protein